MEKEKADKKERESKDIKIKEDGNIMDILRIEVEDRAKEAGSNAKQEFKLIYRKEKRGDDGEVYHLGVFDQVGCNIILIGAISKSKKSVTNILTIKDPSYAPYFIDPSALVNEIRVTEGSIYLIPSVKKDLSMINEEERDQFFQSTVMKSESHIDTNNFSNEREKLENLLENSEDDQDGSSKSRDQLASSPSTQKGVTNIEGQPFDGEEVSSFEFVSGKGLVFTVKIKRVMDKDVRGAFYYGVEFFEKGSKLFRYGERIPKDESEGLDRLMRGIDDEKRKMKEVGMRIARCIRQIESEGIEKLIVSIELLKARNQQSLNVEVYQSIRF